MAGLCVSHNDYVTHQWTHQLLKALTTAYHFPKHSESALKMSCKIRFPFSVHNNPSKSWNNFVILTCPVVGKFPPIHAGRAQRQTTTWFSAHYNPNVNVKLNPCCCFLFNLTCSSPSLHNVHPAIRYSLRMLKHLYLILQNVLLIYMKVIPGHKVHYIYSYWGKFCSLIGL